MMTLNNKFLFAAIIAFCFSSCSETKTSQTNQETINASENTDANLEHRLAKYETVRLTADLSGLTEKEKQMIPLLIRAADIMDGLFWYEAYGKGDSLISVLNNDQAKKFVKINYGPWD
ncbi:MAG: Zn-dependent hydrolase, partial [Bacteroidota bacterium]|nr:Zn-dependent hydrolase [Bacteroidota bacterium]